MIHEPTRIPGVVVFRPTPFRDDRGFFSRTFDAEVARAAGLDPDSMVQDSMSRSAQGTIRALHVRTGAGEGKLVRCSWGRIFDVVVDLRPGSPTRFQWLALNLDGEEQTSVWIPPGCGHGFQALTQPADTSYRIDRPHDPGEALTIAHDDPMLGIPWPLPAGPMSAADRDARPLTELTAELDRIRPRTGP